MLHPPSAVATMVDPERLLMPNASLAGPQAPS